MFTVHIRTDNAAFEDAPGEVARILQVVAERVRDGQTSGRVLDINGNSVGGFGFDDEGESGETVLGKFNRPPR
jgi:hypothetical protein